MRRSTLAALVVLLAVACRDSVGPTAALPTPLELGTGYIIGRQGAPIQVTFQVINGRAIFEGDIDLGPADQVAKSAEELTTARSHDGTSYNVILTGSQFRWPGGYVPYEIEASLPNPQRVLDAMSYITARSSSAVRFAPRTTEAHWVKFRRLNYGSICYSQVGMVSTAYPWQPIDLPDGCDVFSNVHEILHTLGMWHEMSRCDRDDYIQMNWENIPDPLEFQFVKRCSDPNDPNNLAGSIHVGTDVYEYDEGSIMHYGAHATDTSSSQNMPAFTSKRGRDSLFGNRSGMSATDLRTLLYMYPVRRRICC